MIKVIFNLIFVSMVFNGCGSDDTNTTTTEEEVIVETVSNIGANVNGLGYYGDGVIFGNTPILQGVWNVIEIDDNNQRVSNDLVTPQWYVDDRMYMLLSSGATNMGYYGVNEDGTVLYEIWDIINSTTVLTYTYIEEIVFEDKNCLKIASGSNGTLNAMCNIE